MSFWDSLTDSKTKSSNKLYQVTSTDNVSAADRAYIDTLKSNSMTGAGATPLSSAARTYLTSLLSTPSSANPEVDSMTSAITRAVSNALADAQEENKHRAQSSGQLFSQKENAAEGRTTSESMANLADRLATLRGTLYESGENRKSSLADTALNTDRNYQLTLANLLKGLNTYSTTYGKTSGTTVNSPSVLDSMSKVASIAGGAALML